MEAPKQTRHIEQALLDLDEICERNKIEYRVYGSTAYVCAANELYRIPKDVDLFFDISKQEILHSELTKKGYKLEKHPHKLDRILLYPLLRYRKNLQVIEPTGIEFLKNSYQEHIYLPIPLIPKERQPKATLIGYKKDF